MNTLYNATVETVRAAIGQECHCGVGDGHGIEGILEQESDRDGEDLTSAEQSLHMKRSELDGEVVGYESLSAVWKGEDLECAWIETHSVVPNPSWLITLNFSTVVHVVHFHTELPALPLSFYLCIVTGSTTLVSLLARLSQGLIFGTLFFFVRVTDLYVVALIAVLTLSHKTLILLVGGTDYYFHTKQVFTIATIIRLVFIAF